MPSVSMCEKHWSTTDGIFEKVKEEVGELSEVIGGKDGEAIEREYGDLLFTLANLGRFLKLDPESSLRKATDTFTKRFQWIEKKTKQNGETLQSLTPEKWNTFWEEAKVESQKAPSQEVETSAKRS